MGEGFGRVSEKQIEEREKYKERMNKFWRAGFKMVGRRYKGND